ncbi:TolC family protein [Pistricoccus aurantiacus]|nr:TolC family protein [Pistricoccus aurantiacus]
MMRLAWTSSRFAWGLLLALAGLGASIPGSVDAAEALTLDAAVTQALRANPNLKAVSLEHDALALEPEIARGARYPELELGSSYTHYSDPYLVHPIEQPGVFPPLDDDITSVGATMRLPLYAGGRLVAGESLAASRSESALQRLHASEQDLLFNVVATYAKALQLRDLTIAEGRRIEGLQAEVEAIQRKLDQGRAARLEVLRVQTRLSQAQFDQGATAQGERDAQGLLAALLGMPLRDRVLKELPNASFEVPGSADAAAELAAREHPQVRQAQAEWNAAADRLAIARGERLPEVDLVAETQTRRGDDWEGRDDWYVGMTLSVPLFDGGIRRKRVNQAEFERQQYRERLRGVVDDVTTEARAAFGGLQTADQRLQSARRALEEAEEALRIETRKYRAGRSTVTDLLSAEAARWTALASLNQAEYERFVADIRLYRALGRLTPTLFTGATSLPAESMSEGKGTS